jgi:hypothetical protein
MIGPETVGDEFLAEILEAEKKLKSSIPEIQEQIEELENNEGKRAYYVCNIRGSANTQRDLKKMLETIPLIPGEAILVGREVQVTKKVRVEYEFA